jgi:hypothetical protein
MGPARVRSPWLAGLGLVLVAVVALGLLRSTLSVTDAALRLGVGVLVLVVVERLLLPLGAALVGGRRDEPAPPG